MDKNAEFYDTCSQALAQITKKSDSFLEASESVTGNLKEALKNIYDFTKKEEIKNVKSSALPELIVRNFDLEQIWQQIELQNESLLTRSLTNVSKLIVGKDKLLFKNLKREHEDAVEEKPLLEVSDKEADSEDFEDNNDETSHSDSPEEEEEEAKNAHEPQSHRGKPSIVDDDFFKLDEMERFLKGEEKKLHDPDSGNDSENSESDSEDVDLFDEDVEDTVRTAKYKDFFVAQDDKQSTTKRNKFLEEYEENAEQEKSSFEHRQDRLKRKIDELEEEAVEDKPWQLKGEVTGENRPQNSLLAEVVEFDLSTRPAPVITEATSMQLEDVIKQRIKDAVFDSVQRKFKPADTPLEFKKRLVLDQEKSKESLAQIYEKEFLEQKSRLEPDNADKAEPEPELHKEINKMMTGLFNKLDALSNFHFTPKPAIPELKIVSNLPAITMEEVAPVASTDSNLLAPEEVKSKLKADLVGKNERSATDKKRERRKKKLKQRIHSGEKQKLSKKELVKSRNVELMDESVKSVKSSKAFFSQLEDEVKAQIKGKSVAVKRKNSSLSSAKKLKL